MKAVLLAAAVVVVGVSIAHAEGPYDGSVPMKCSGRTARITPTGQGAGKLMIAGQDTQTLGKMWGLVVDQKTGAMSGAILSHGDGTLLFGTCTAP